MKKTISIIAMATLCIFFSGIVQSQTTNPTFKPVKIGDRVPDVILTNIYNYKTTKANLSDFKAKLIILDFWGTSCPSCLADFPKTDELQKQYGEEVQFIRVAYQPKAIILPFLAKFYKGKPSIIPVITDDKALLELFPHIYIPHYVWLDQTGKVVAATTGDQLTAENIDRFLSNNNTGDMRVKVDIDRSKPLFITNDLLKNNQLKHYSIFFKGMYDGLASGIKRLSNDRGIQTGLTMTNFPLTVMYDLVIEALYEQRGILYNDVKRIIQVKDPSKLIVSEKINEENCYSYVCNSPDVKSIPLYQYVLEDLNRYTGYIGSIEKTKVKCLVLRRIGKVDKIKTKGGRPQMTLFRTADSKITNYPIKPMLVSMVDLPFIKMPLVDETGYTSNVDISLSQQTSLPVLQKELKAYNLELIETVRELDMFILRDKN